MSCCPSNNTSSCGTYPASRSGPVLIGPDGNYLQNGDCVMTCQQVVDYVSQHGGSPVVGGTTLGGGTGTVVINNTLVNPSNPGDLTSGYTLISNTNSNGWVTGLSRCILDTEFTTNGFFTQNPNAVLLIGLRASTAPGVIDAHGVLMGKVPFPENAAISTLTAGVGLWSPTGGTYPAYSPRPHGSILGLTIQDGTRYRLVVESTKHTEGFNTLRYTLFTWESVTQQWRLLRDTGDVLDSNPQRNMTSEAVYVGFVFADKNLTWNITFTNARVTWKEAGERVTQNTFSAWPSICALNAQQVLANPTADINPSVNEWVDTTVKWGTQQFPNELISWNGDFSIATVLKDCRLQIAINLEIGAAKLGGSSGSLYTSLFVEAGGNVGSGRLKAHADQAGPGTPACSGVCNWTWEASMTAGAQIRVFASVAKEALGAATPYFYVGPLQDNNGREPPSDGVNGLNVIRISEVRS